MLRIVTHRRVAEIGGDNMLIRQVVVATSVLCLAALLLVVLTSFQAAQAAPMAVNLLVVDRDDDAPGLACTPVNPIDCTLRSAIQIANSDGTPDVINFASGTHTITL